jgi:hypothetical protein
MDALRNSKKISLLAVAIFFLFTFFNLILDAPRTPQASNNEPRAITIIRKNKHELYHMLCKIKKSYYRLWEKYSRLCSAALSTVQRNDAVLSRLETVPFSRLFSCEGNIEYTWAAVVQNTESYRLEHALIAILSILDGGKVRGTCFEL